MPMLADQIDAVVGVDTHRDTHQAELTAPTGVPLAFLTIPNSDAGFAALLDWIEATAPGPRVPVSIEGARSHGAGLARAVSTAGRLVLEAEQPSRRDRRRRGKSDPIDAHFAAMFALAQHTDRLPTPRADGNREALRILVVARDELTSTATAQTNRLRALLLQGEERDRDLARHALTDTVLTGLARRRTRAGATALDAVRQQEIRRLALALRANHTETKHNRAQLRDLVEATAPGLMDRPGIGPVTAAQAVISYSHPGRVRDDAAFAALAGTSPIPASSGQTIQHRLNRGGDRALNSAIHTIAVTRMRSCPRTRAYVARRTAEGKGHRHIRRILKRYITREIYRTLNATMT